MQKSIFDAYICVEVLHPQISSLSTVFKIIITQSYVFIPCYVVQKEQKKVRSNNNLNLSLD